MERVWVAFVIVCMAAFPIAAFGQPATNPTSVFELVVMAHDGGRYKSITLGTAFFVNPDGTALTNSHVVYQAEHDPGRYRLLALVGEEFYGVRIVCATRLQHDPTQRSAVRASLDVAVIKLAPSKFPFTRLEYTNRQGTSEIIATAHLGSLPQFPALTVRGDPSVGEAIQVIGFGQESAFTTKVSRWVATGTVDKLGAARDGTPVFQIAFVIRPGSGGSGSPVLDHENRVVGVYTWTLYASSAFSGAIGASALKKPC
jgi:S1-C subfamily serine protease